ncbi:MAG: 2-C-methyl-D-erythritol 4-phosphate cytidylyltransferase [Nitrospirae bacterium RBG_13_41_22]|nr:MAG: 2-C-methyl-D-erythritol 4-phosphate cytidylyltransferase [Nitrospirae bacterium RBG_13_41_22]
MKGLQRQVRVFAIVPAAGKGKRFGPGTNKPLQNLISKPLIIWSLKALENVIDIVEIIPVLKVEDMERGRNIFEEYGLSKIKRIAPGGKERQDSVYNGLKLIENTNCIVLIHDGVRPLIEKPLIEGMIKQMSEILQKKEQCDGIILGVPLRDTIKVAEDGIIKKTLRRDSLWAIQTPQVFPYSNIFSAYERAMKEGFYSTDDAAIVERYGGKIKVVMGSYRNIKITTPEDLAIAEILLSRRD